jgi:hypothetical protein
VLVTIMKSPLKKLSLSALDSGDLAEVPSWAAHRIARTSRAAVLIAHGNTNITRAIRGSINPNNLRPIFTEFYDGC